MADDENPYEVVAAMLDEAHRLPPWLVPLWVANHARRVGALESTVYLHDYDQRRLVPLTAEAVGSEVIGTVSIDGSLPGRCFALGEQTSSEDEDGVRLNSPLIDGANRMGVHQLLLPSLDDARRLLGRRLAAAVTSLIATKGTHTDVYFRARRRRTMTLAAEMQWQLLPPLTVTDPRVSIAGILEPAYSVGGDAFDYAVNHDVAHLGIFDAMGHGLDASVMSAVAVGAYRHARRGRVPVADMYAMIDRAFSEQFGSDRFVTAQLADLHLPSGQFTFVNAGHPPPLLVRGRKVIRRLTGPLTLPIGLGGHEPEVFVEQLEPGDRLLLYTDGVVDGRRGGEPFGDERLVEALEAELAADLPLDETQRRLNMRVTDWQDESARDDATLVLLEWHARDLPDY